MPLVLSPAQLRPGMKTHLGVRKGTTLIVQAERELSDKDIDRMRDRYPTLRVSVYSPELESRVPFEDDSRDYELSDQARAMSNECMACVQKGQRDARSKEREFTKVEKAVLDVTDFIVRNPVGQVLPKSPYESESYLEEHAGAVFYLAMTLATQVQHYVITERMRTTYASNLSFALAQCITPLGLGALYMDVGMGELADILEKPEPLTAVEWKKVHAHPDRSSELLPHKFPPAGRMVVKTHHVNADGTGYPQAMNPDRIHVFTRIIRIADAFDAAISPRPYRKAKSAVRALWELAMGPDKHLYDAELVKAFCQMIQPFPIGTPLKLADGTLAVVSGQSRDAFAPKVVVTHDSAGKMIDKEHMDPPFKLEPSGRTRIASVDGEDLAYLYDPHAGEREAEQRRAEEAVRSAQRKQATPGRDAA